VRGIVMLAMTVGCLASYASAAPARLRVEFLDIITGGMLLDFKTAQPVASWMKAMLIPLDRHVAGLVVYIARNAAPMSKTLSPSGGAPLLVIALPGVRTAEIGAKPGDLVRKRRIHH
jgi:uncharacterized membrane protein (UPF0127 family)